MHWLDLPILLLLVLIFLGWTPAHQGTLRRFRIMTDNTAATAAAIDQLKADVTAEKGQVASIATLVAGFAAALAAAVASAKDAGATDAQLADLAQLHADISADTQGIVDAVNANPLPGDPGPTPQPDPQPAPAPFTLTVDAPDGVVGQSYTGGVSSDTAGLQYSILDGALPDGLSMSGGGAISGTPTTANDDGTPKVSSVTVQAHDANNAQAVAPFTITIAAAAA